MWEGEYKGRNITAVGMAFVLGRAGGLAAQDDSVVRQQSAV